MSRERLPDGWRWDAEEGPWACHAIGPHGRAATVFADGSLGTTGRSVPRDVIATCYRRAERIFGLAPEGGTSSEPSEPDHDLVRRGRAPDPFHDAAERVALGLDEGGPST